MMRKLNFAVLAFFLLLLAAGCTFSFNLEKDMGPILMIYDEETSLVTIQNEIADNSEYSSIHYTLDGSTPTEKSPEYTAPIPVEKGTLVKAVVFTYFPEFAKSPCFEITVRSQAEPLPEYRIFDDRNGMFIYTFIPEDATEVYYTLDGNDPREETDSRIRYTEPFSASYDTKIRFCALWEGHISKAYSVPPRPEITFELGTDATYVAVKAQDGAEIFYTADGTSPIDNGKPYTAPVPITSQTVFQACVKVDGFFSPVASAGIPSLTSAPEITIRSARNNSTVELTAPAGSTVYYSLNGLEPYLGNGGLLYKGPFTAANGSLVKAVAEFGGVRSAVAEKAVPATPVAVSLEYIDDDYCLVTMKSDDNAVIRYEGDGTFGYYRNPFKARIGSSFKVSVSLNFSKLEEYSFTIPAATVPETPSMKYEKSEEGALVRLYSTEWARIWYTTDGSVPEVGVSNLYEEAFVAPVGSRIRAVAVIGYNESDEFDAVIPVDVPFVEVKHFKNDSYVSMTAEPGAEIHYRLSNTPADFLTEDDPVYSGPIKVSNRGYITVAACLGGSWSDTASYHFTNMYPPADVLDISYTAVGRDCTVTISGQEEGTKVFYTTDGSDPRGTAYNTEYNGPFVAKHGETVRAIAYRNGVFSESIFEEQVLGKKYTVRVTTYDDEVMEFTVVEGDEFDLNQFERKGYTLTGITDTDNYGTTYTPDQKLTVNSDMNLRCDWQINTYTVTIVSEDYENIILTYEYHGWFSLSDIKRSGYEVASLTDENGNKYYPINVLAIERDMTFTAEWRLADFTLSIYFDGVLEQTLKHPRGESFSIDSITKRGYVLDYVSADSKYYHSGDVLTVENDMSLYYWWKESKKSSMFTEHTARMISFLNARNNPEYFTETERIQYIMDIYLLSFPIPVSSLDSYSDSELESYAYDAERSIKELMPYIPTANINMAQVEVSYVGGAAHTYRFEFVWNDNTYRYILKADDYAWYIYEKPEFPDNFDISYNYGDSSLTYSNFQSDLGFNDNYSTYSTNVPCTGYWNTPGSTYRDYSEMSSTQLQNYNDTLRSKESEYPVTKTDKYFPTKAVIRGNEFLEFKRFRWGSNGILVCQLFIQYADGSFKNWILTPGLPTSIF